MEGPFRSSVNFNVYRLMEEIVKYIPRVDGEESGNLEKLIEQRIKHKKFLLVLDDMWNCGSEGEWKSLLLPFRKGQKKGSTILVTTRFPSLAELVKTSDIDPILLEGLDSEMFWKLFSACVFGNEQSENNHRDLHETGQKIVKKLKGNPLAAKTVGRLLRKQLDLDHWTRVLESKEWELQSGGDDIMPALKLSYDYLSFHLQQCFTYCSLFPEDYRFEENELIHLWIGLNVLHSNGGNKRIEDIGHNYLNDLVDLGFFKKDKNEDGRPCYIIHDLLHELALKVSSYVCLSIYSSNLRSIQIPPAVRHLSIIIDDTSVKDRMTFEDHKNQLGTLEKRLAVENLHSLMIFGKYHGSFTKIFANLFRPAKALRVILLLGASYHLENFSGLVHLRYLRIEGERELFSKIILTSSISRLYHLRVLNLERSGSCCDVPRDMNNLVNMRHFLVPEVELDTTICDVGKLKHLQQLKRFEVRKDVNGFELFQLGKLEEIGGSLCIGSLENVQEKEAADEAKLMHKNHLHELTLEWGIWDPTLEDLVLENLRPHSNLRKLGIRGHGGTTCPTWLGLNLSCANLESLSLVNIAWTKLPNLGEMWVIDKDGKEIEGCIRGHCFEYLRRLELVKISSLKKWVWSGTHHLFSHLEELVIKDCSELMQLPFPDSSCNQSEQEAIKKCFPGLRELEIVNCPKLLSLPPIPWKRGLRSVKMEGLGLGFSKIDYSEDNRLEIIGNSGQGSVAWEMLAFYNLIYLKKLVMRKCPPLCLGQLQMLTSLKSLEIYDSSNVILPVDGEEHDTHPLPLECVSIDRCGASGEELTQVLSHFPKLTGLILNDCKKITGLGVIEGEETSATLASEGLLLLPPQVQELGIYDSPELCLASQGLQGLRSLRSLNIIDCPKFVATSSSSFPFPVSLQDLCLIGVEGMDTLSNLAALTRLSIQNYLLSLTTLRVHKTPNFFAGWSEALPVPGLQELWTDDVAGVLVTPLCSLLSSSLNKLAFQWNEEMERFAEEQEEALCNLASLQELRIESCHKLQCLPAGIRRLASLKLFEISHCPVVQSLPKDCLPTSLQELIIWDCPAISSLPKDGLPTSLQGLNIWGCPAISSLPKDGLPTSLQGLRILGCPAIRSLPKDGLPTSLRLLHVPHDVNSEELIRHCRKLRGTIPIIIT